MSEGCRKNKKIALALNVALLLLFVMLLVIDKTGSYGIFALLALFPVISIVTFARESPGRGLLGVCWMGYAVASVLMGLTTITSLLMTSRVLAFALAALACGVYAAVGIYSSLTGFKLWKLSGVKVLA